MNYIKRTWSLHTRLATNQKHTRAEFVVCMVVGFVLGVFIINAAIAAFFEGSIYPGVLLQGNDLSNKTRQDARIVIGALPDNYKLNITTANKTFSTTTGEIGAEYDVDKTLALAYNAGRSTLPLLGVWRARSEGKIGYVYKLDQEKLSRFTADLAQKIGTSPVNATLVIKDGVVSRVEDIDGISVKAETLNTIITQSLSNSDNQTIAVNPEPIAADVQIDHLGDAETQTNTYLARTITISAKGKSFRATKADMGHWIHFEVKKVGLNKQLIATVDQKEIKGWVQSIANQVNVQPKNRKVTVRDGVSSVDQEGVDGSAIDQDATSAKIVAAMQATQDLAYEAPLKSIPYKTETNSSVSLNYPQYIEINLSKQRLWAYENNQPILSSTITSGATGAGFGTVTGLFHVYYKTTGTYLNGRPYGWDYNVFVKYWMPFFGGYGLHDASWRSSFGGQDYYYGGSHGCVNLPENTAAFLYSWAPVGTPVWVHK